jgi:hypothetical protein
MRGITPAELIPPCEIPSFLIPLWNDFSALNQSRTAGMALNPIQYLEIEAYSRLMKIRFSRFDVFVIKKLDALFMASQKDKNGS